jgi:hypothetical protein
MDTNMEQNPKSETKWQWFLVFWIKRKKYTTKLDMIFGRLSET